MYAKHPPRELAPNVVEVEVGYEQFRAKYREARKSYGYRGQVYYPSEWQVKRDYLAGLQTRPDAMLEHYVRSGRYRTRVEPKPDPKGPADVWEWLAYLEDAGKLRWWHLVLANVGLLPYPTA